MKPATRQPRLPLIREESLPLLGALVLCAGFGVCAAAFPVSVYFFGSIQASPVRWLAGCAGIMSSGVATMVGGHMLLNWPLRKRRRRANRGRGSPAPQHRALEVLPPNSDDGDA